MNTRCLPGDTASRLSGCSPDGGGSVPHRSTAAHARPAWMKWKYILHRDKNRPSAFFLLLLLFRFEHPGRKSRRSWLMASGSGDDEAKARGGSWRLVGPAARLSATRCRLVYCSLGRDADVCLFHVRGEFFAMDARCAHSGGPLCEGDIEEADGVLQVFCPWHDYDFDLRTGKSGTSLQQQVYEVKLEDGNVFVKHAGRLSLEPLPAEQKES